MLIPPPCRERLVLEDQLESRVPVEIGDPWAQWEHQGSQERPAHRETEARVDSRVFLDLQAHLDSLDQLDLKDHLEMLEHRSDTNHVSKFNIAKLRAFREIFLIAHTGCQGSTRASWTSWSSRSTGRLTRL